MSVSRRTDNPLNPPFSKGDLRKSPLIGGEGVVWQNGGRLHAWLLQIIMVIVVTVKIFVLLKMMTVS
jgi:hypothetical protein